MIGDGYMYYLMSDMQGMYQIVDKNQFTFNMWWDEIHSTSNHSNSELDFQGELKTEMPFCSHNKTIADALYMLNIKRDSLQQGRKKVLISIGASDLRNDRPFGDMKRDFTHLFLECDRLGLKPLITTVLCIDSPDLKLRADMFNNFLMENFENVVDMQQVGRYGLANAMLITHNR